MIKYLSAIATAFVLIGGLYTASKQLVFAGEYTVFRTQQQLHWTDYNTNRLMEQYVTLGNEDKLSPVEKHWMQDIQDKLNKYRKRHDVLEKRLADMNAVPED